MHGMKKKKVEGKTGPEGEKTSHSKLREGKSNRLSGGRKTSEISWYGGSRWVSGPLPRQAYFGLGRMQKIAREQPNKTFLDAKGKSNSETNTPRHSKVGAYPSTKAP